MIGTPNPGEDSATNDGTHTNPSTNPTENSTTDKNQKPATGAQSPITQQPVDSTPSAT